MTSSHQSVILTIAFVGLTIPYFPFLNLSVPFANPVVVSQQFKDTRIIQRTLLRLSTFSMH